VAFGGLSGDYFYMQFDEIAAKESPFGKRIAHGCFVLSEAARLFVSPAPGPALANPKGSGRGGRGSDQSGGELVASYDILTMVAKRA